MSLFVIRTILPTFVLKNVRAIIQGQRRTRSKLHQPFQYEQSIRNRGYPYVVGCDEVGRGALAGPVVAASCTLLLKPSMTASDIKAILEQEEQDLFTLVDDSKILSESMRYNVYQKIHDKPELYGFSFAERNAQDIDRLNILNASMECFAESIETLVTNYQLPTHETYCIVDGNKSPKLLSSITCRPYVQGDAHILTIAMASILAKVKRDQFMITKAHRLYPQYGFDVHKGYPTRNHILAIHKYGPSPIHRMSFKPLKGR